MKAADDLHRILYVSAAVRRMSAAELDDLLLVARADNAISGVTGALLYADGDFIQLLEGPRDPVLDTFARIQASPLHGGVIALVNAPAQARQFPNWAMAYSSGSWSELKAVQSAWETSADAGVDVLRQFALRHGLG